MPREYITKDGRRFRTGVSTGSCAALAAKAAARMLFTQATEASVSVVTPAGMRVDADVLDARMENGSASCAVRKDAGDDPDVTDGILIHASVTRTDDGGIVIDGGPGVGRVTRPGLDQPVGAAAINTIPRRMIEAAVREACGEFGYVGGLRAVISIPDGETVARKTFNAGLGIVGGLSILGTSGIVEPMSDRAVVDTIAAELAMLRAEGARQLLLTPGNYGETFIASRPELSRVRRVKCSNHIGEALDAAIGLGFSGIIIVGHVGKMVKLAAGIMNTHSRVADGRLDILALHAGLAGGDAPLMRAILDAATVDAGLSLLAAADMAAPVIQSILAQTDRHLARRASGTVPIGAVMFSRQSGLVGVSDAADRLLCEWNGNL